MTFRIMPAQHLEKQQASGVRYGFIIPNHPHGHPGKDFGPVKHGDYVATWATRERAEAAAHCLGFSPDDVGAIGYWIPS